MCSIGHGVNLPLYRDQHSPQQRDWLLALVRRFTCPLSAQAVKLHVCYACMHVHTCVYAIMYAQAYTYQSEAVL
jgi:hypothetical protein